MVRLVVYESQCKDTVKPKRVCWLLQVSAVNIRLMPIKSIYAMLLRLAQRIHNLPYLSRSPCPCLSITESAQSVCKSR